MSPGVSLATGQHILKLYVLMVLCLRSGNDTSTSEVPFCGARATVFETLLVGLNFTDRLRA